MMTKRSTRPLPSIGGRELHFSTTGNAPCTMKPFKPLTITRPQLSAPQRPEQSLEPAAKRRRISDESVDDDPVNSVATTTAAPKQRKPVQTFQAPTRAPLTTVQNPSCSLPSSSQSQSVPEQSYNVLWRKFTTKKNKTWDGDGILVLIGGFAVLKDVSGRELGRTACKEALTIGSELSFAGREIQVESVIGPDDSLPRDTILANSSPAKAGFRNGHKLEKPSVKPVGSRSKTALAEQSQPKTTAPSIKPTNAAFKAPLLVNTVQLSARSGKIPVPRHDPTKENALVMKRPRDVPTGKHIVDVVVDPLLTHGERRLRDHQREGVAFLYECVMGMKAHVGEGAILADEMGLGKTLQTIALLWTLLKQNPIFEDPPVIKKALIVCPVTLINTWRREFNRWLGPERIGVLVVKDKNVRLTDFTRGRSYSVMIIGYEKLRMVQEDLQKGDGIDIVIADEGHRLKTAQNKSAMAIKSLKTERRIILSGTPVQNDLAEFYTMVDFVNPGLLNKYSTFRRQFENPIIRGRQPHVTPEEKEKGEERNRELNEITKEFQLRRTAEILSNYLPPKTEYVLFCKPTSAQLAVYRAILGSPIYNSALGSTSLSLELINILRKVCNGPNLLLKKTDDGATITKQELLDCVPQSALQSPGASTKLQVLDSLLHHIRTTTDEKVVLVSNWTSTMDILANLLTSLSYKFLRLDGTTPSSKRQDLVDQFNRSPATKSFIFLLSAKAGGTGLNLQGASRLVLFDLDWNPATDLQAMARIHRDGQRSPCYIYRLITQGALDEKIFQRQVSKTGLANSIVDGKSGVSGFTLEELRDLFSLDESSDCQTHTLLGCVCDGDGLPLHASPDKIQIPSEDPSGPCSDGTVRDEQGLEIARSDSDDSNDIPTSGGSFKKASQYDEQLDGEDSHRKETPERARMLSLMQYAHFDTSRVTATLATAEDGFEDIDRVLTSSDPVECVIEDPVLRSVLRERERRIGFVFSKVSG